MQAARDARPATPERVGPPVRLIPAKLDVQR